MSAIAIGGGYRPVVQLHPTTPRSHLRLTKRGRVVLTTLASIPFVIAALIFALNGGGAAASLEGSIATHEYVSVASGQTLWQVAKQIAPNADPRDVVADILDLNGLTSAEVFPGQQLAIPDQYAN
jgi:LysM domain